MGEARLLSLMAPAPVVLLFVAMEVSGLAGLRGTGVARVTVWRLGAEVGDGLAASFGVRVARFAKVGIWWCWREDDVGAAVVEEADERS